MIGGEQQKLLVNMGDDGIIHLDENFAELLGVIESEFNWKLVREHDGLTKQSKEIGWIDWNDDGYFKDKHPEIAIGRSLLMSPFNQCFTWQTTPVIEIISQTEDLIEFKTQNSNYKLFKI
jgi:hypothetical protein